MYINLICTFFYLNAVPLEVNNLHKSTRTTFYLSYWPVTIVFQGIVTEVSAKETQVEHASSLSPLEDQVLWPRILPYL